jgi:iron complex outermembrane receptor protein
MAAQGPGGELTGVVLGPNKTSLSGAQVTIRRLEDGTVVSVVAGARGIYRALGLRAGKYQITAELQNFAPRVVSDVALAEGETKSVDLTLAIATVQTIVTVIGSAPRDSLEAAQARESSARDVGEALSQIGGVWKLRKGGIASDVVLRGFQSKDLNVLIDGERMYGACPNHMDPPAFHADFAEVDRIEIGKGPFDVKNQGSLGGVVNIVTRRPEAGFHASGNLATGSYGFVNPAATLSYGAGKFSALAGYSYRLSNPYTDGAGKRFTSYANYRADAMESDAFRVGTAWGKVSAVPLTNQLVELSYTRQAADHMLYPYLQMDAVYDNADRAHLAYQIDHVSDFITSLRFNGYFSQVHHWMTDQYRLSSVNVARAYSMGTLAASRSFGGRVEAGLRAFNLGLETYRREWNTTTVMAGSGYQTQYSIPDVKNDFVGIYAEYGKKLTDQLRLDIGARIDAARNVADAAKANTSLYYAYNSTRSTSSSEMLPSGNVRLSYNSPLGFEVSGGVGHTSRVPEPEEQYYALRRMGSDWVGNPSLAPSQNTGVDGAFSFRRHGLFFGSSVYFDRVKDYITVNSQQKINMVAGVMNSLARSYQNVAARLYGGELEAVYGLTQRVYLSSNVSYVRGAQDPIASKGILSRNLPEMPPLRSRAGIRYATGRISAELEGVFVTRQNKVNSDLAEAPTAGYGTANLGVSGEFKRFTIRIGLQNLFDRYYTEHLSFQRDPFRTGVRVPEPGRNLFLNIGYRY